MSTKNKGEILAERIEYLATQDWPLTHLRRVIGEALAEYRKPWTLGRTVNGFTLGDGQEWHRQDWTEDMLPDGWRPRIRGEKLSDYIDCKHDSASAYWGCWQTPGNFIDESEFFFRTRSPLPSVARPILTPAKWAAEKAAFERGEKIQVQNVDEWINFVPKDKNDPPPWTGNYRFRIAPEPVLVALGPDDVKCGDEIKAILGNQNRLSIAEVSPLGIYTRRTEQTWKELQEFCLIDRHDGRGFVPCEKPADAKEAK